MFEAARRLVNFARPAKWTFAHHLTSLPWRLLMPGVCALCGGGAQWQRCRGGLDLCAHCEAALLPAAPPPPALVTRTGATRILAAFRYAPPADFMIRQLKFGGQRCHARVLGTLLAERAARESAGLPGALVPLPLHPGRLRERGYNQAAELALFAGRALRLPVWPRVLERVREGQVQSSLPAAVRAANVRGAFAAGALPKGCRVALVDDVLTTGSTAAAAVRCLREAGAAGVEVWVACRAEMRDPAG